VFVTEFHQTQLVTAQPVYSRPERGNGQKLMVDGESRCYHKAATKACWNNGLCDRQASSEGDQATIRSTEACSFVRASR